MRARNIKPGFCSNKKLLRCRVETHLIYSMLWMMADREGRLDDDPEQIAIDSFFIVRGIDCEPLIAELAECGLLTRYEVEGKKYLQINGFREHQNPHKNENQSVIPGPLAPLLEHSSNYQSNPADSLIPDSLIPEKKHCGQKRFVHPSLDEVKAYCVERKNTVDPEKWLDFYLSNGWKVGKNSMKDWKAAVRTWERNGIGKGAEQQPEERDDPEAARKLAELAKLKADRKRKLEEQGYV